MGIEPRPVVAPVRARGLARTTSATPAPRHRPALAALALALALALGHSVTFAASAAARAAELGSRERERGVSAVTAPAPTALTWRRTSYSTSATPAQRLVQVMYPFKNTSDHPVRITTITTSCGCTTAGDHRDIYVPGESGVIPVTFTIGNRRGPQDKEILVFTDESPRPYALALHVKVEPLYSIESASTLSGAGDGRVREYTFTITAQTAAPILVTSATSAVPLQTRIEAVTPGRKYVVHLAAYPGDRQPLVPGARPVAVSLQIYVDGVGNVTEPATLFVR